MSQIGLIYRKSIAGALFDPLCDRHRIIRATYTVFMDEKGEWNINSDVSIQIIDGIGKPKVEIDVVEFPIFLFRAMTDQYCLLLKSEKVLIAMAKSVNDDFARWCSI